MSRQAAALTLLLVLGGALLVAAANLVTPPGSALHVPDFAVPLAGKYLCFAMLALAVDLVWGFAGILSLGHAAFFALGGYAMGMYLMRAIGARGIYGNAVLPDFMVFLNWTTLPWYWHGFDHFAFALAMALVVPAVLAGLFGWLAFRSRVTGVYLSIITQALTYALLLAFFRNDMGFGGNNGLTDFKTLLGFPLATPGMRCALLLASAVALSGCFLLVRWMVRSRYGKVLVAVRDAESRTRFLGYRPEHYKLLAWTVSAAIAGPRRCALRAAGRHHQPQRVRARQLHRGRDLGRGRRPGHALWRYPRRRPGQPRQDLAHGAVPRGLAVRPRRPVRRGHAGAPPRRDRPLRPAAAGRAGGAAHAG